MIRHRWVVVAALAAGAQGAYADPDPNKPWAAGVSVEHQAEAQAIFEEGNTLFAQLAHAPALERYRAALKIWDHPLIRFNLAVTEIRLDRALEAADDLEQALRWGEAPFKPELYQQALDYQALLKRQVATVEVTCTQAGTSVQLDGKQWFTCPGTQRQRVMAGEHAIIGELPGYLPVSRRIVTSGGTTTTEQLQLVPLESAITLEYRHRRWIPWTITSAGVAVGLVGAGIWFAGRSQMATFDDNFAKECTTVGCEKGLADHPSLRDQRDGAQLKGTIGVAMMVTGGAVVVGGVAFVLMNRPRRVMPSFEVAPTKGGAQAAVGWRF